MPKLRSILKPFKALLRIKKSKTGEEEKEKSQQKEKRRQHEQRHVYVQSPPKSGLGGTSYPEALDLPSRSLYGQNLSSSLNYDSHRQYQDLHQSQSPPSIHPQYHSSRSSSRQELPHQHQVYDSPISVPITVTAPGVPSISQRSQAYTSYRSPAGSSRSPSSSREEASNYYHEYRGQHYTEYDARQQELETYQKSDAIPIRITVSAPTGRTEAQRRQEYTLYYRPSPEELAHKPLPPRPGEVINPAESLRPSIRPSTGPSVRSPAASSYSTASTSSHPTQSPASPPVISLASPSRLSPSVVVVTPIAAAPQLPSRAPSAKESSRTRSAHHEQPSPISLKPSLASVLPTPKPTPPPPLSRGESLRAIYHGLSSTPGLGLTPTVVHVPPALSREASPVRVVSPIQTPTVPIHGTAALPNTETNEFEARPNDYWAPSASPARTRMPSPSIPLISPVPQPVPEPSPSLHYRRPKPFPSPPPVPADPRIAAPSPVPLSSHVDSVEVITIKREPTPPLPTPAASKQKARKLSKVKPSQGKKASKQDLQAAPAPVPVPIPEPTPVPQLPAPTPAPAPVVIKQSPTPAPQQRARKASTKAAPAPVPVPVPVPAPVAATPIGSRRPSNAQRPLKRPDEGVSNQENEHFKSLRAQARAEGDLMAKAFKDSKAAYEAGNGARAKELSLEGKVHKEEMERLNKEASDWIFKENNRDRSPNEIDLHGLYVKEAAEQAEEAVIAAKARGDPRIRIIVGKGLHSADGVQKLKPAIEDLTAKYRLTTILDPDNAGVLLVNLQGQQRKARGLDPT